MNQDDPLQQQTRRHFFHDCGIGVGAMALSSLLSGSTAAAAETASGMTARTSQLVAKAKRVIYLFMAGGPSQLDMFDHKPMLNKLSGEPMPQSYLEGKRFAFMGSSHRTNLLGTRRRFRQHGDSGAWVSDVLPHTASIVDKLTFIKTCKTDLFNHAPAKLFMNTGSGQFGRPSLGSWLTYGLGSECTDLPGFVVLQSGPRGPRGGSVLWGSGMLPTTYQGVPLRNKGEPILNLTTPAAVTEEQQAAVFDSVRRLNSLRLQNTGDEEIATRINAYEMAYRMQTSAPELMDTASMGFRILANQALPETVCWLVGWWKEVCVSYSCITPTGIIMAGRRRTWNSICLRSARRLISPVWHWCVIWSSEVCWTTRSSSGAENSDALRWAKFANRRAAIITLMHLPCGLPEGALNRVSHSVKRTNSDLARSIGLSTSATFMQHCCIKWGFPMNG